MAKRGTLNQEAEVSDINISPMIDMVFILLIFFIVTTVFTQEPGVEVVREPAITDAQLERNSVLIAVTPSGEVWYGGQPVGVSGVKAIVTRNVKENPRMPVIIQPDRGAPSETVIRVVNEAKYASANTPVFFSTIND
ncbi:MAG: biopolymer transport protein ExbD [Puniceicoccaceae bacterium 5H]|nr:MAG: biopolymer transport protein ExbD [Puniceicoccaceae bacterium 5H]